MPECSRTIAIRQLSVRITCSWRRFQCESLEFSLTCSRRLAIVVSTTLLTLVFVASGAAYAKEGVGSTPIQRNTGLLTVRWNATSQNSFMSVEGEFASLSGVGNPRIDVRLLDDRNNEVAKFERSWTGKRERETAHFDINSSFETPTSRVCASLYEAGGLVDTACSPVTF